MIDDTSVEDLVSLLKNILKFLSGKNISTGLERRARTKAANG